MTLDEKISAMTTALDNWESSFGLREPGLDFDGVDRIIKLPRLNDLSGREACESAFVLAQFAFAAQRQENQCRAFLQWGSAVRNSFSGSERDRLNDLMVKAEQRLMRVQFVSRQAEFMSQCLHNLQREKQREEG